MTANLLLAAALAASAPPAGGGLSAEAEAQARLHRCGTEPAAERARLTAERAELTRRINDLALGRRPRKKASGGDVAREVAGTAAAVLLPFPLGVAARAAGAAAKSGGRPARPDAAPLVERVQEIEARLERLEGC